MRYTYKDLVNMVAPARRAEFTMIYEYLHKIDNPQDNDLMSKVTKHFKVTASDIKSNKRITEVVLARQVYMTAIKVCSTKTLAEVARTVDKDHATVCHAMKVIKGDYAFNAVRRNKIRHFIADLEPEQQELLLEFFNERNPDILAAYAADSNRVTAPSQFEA
jgi:hypothetical protein